MKRAFTRKRHRPEEIVAKLREADEALSQGKTLEDVAKLLGVSLMTLHRWRTEYGSTDRDAVKRCEHRDHTAQANSARIMRSEIPAKKMSAELGFFSVLLGQRRENGTEFSNELIESQLPRSQLMLSHPKNAKHVLAAEVLCDDRSRF